MISEKAKKVKVRLTQIKARQKGVDLGKLTAFNNWIVGQK